MMPKLLCTTKNRKQNAGDTEPLAEIIKHEKQTAEQQLRRWEEARRNSSTLSRVHLCGLWSSICSLRTQKPIVSIKRIQMEQSPCSSAKNSREVNTDENKQCPAATDVLLESFLICWEERISLPTRSTLTPPSSHFQAVNAHSKPHNQLLTFISFILHFLATAFLDPFVHVLFCYFHHFSLFQSASIRVIHQRNVGSGLNKRFIHQNCKQKSTEQVKAY